MTAAKSKSASPVAVIFAFAIVYIVWGSTYYFIQQAVHGFPPFLLGALRFITAGALLLGWCLFSGEKIFIKTDMLHSAVSGVLLLFVGTGVVIWVEQTLPSAMVAIMVSSSPIWLVLLDKQNWKINLKSRSTIAGLIAGFAGVVLLFSANIARAFSSARGHAELVGLGLLVVGTVSWAAGSLYSKSHASQGSVRVNAAWQMIAAGIAFVPGSLLRQESQGLDWMAIPLSSWLSLLYLILIGSIAAFSAYVWLLQVRPATQVSTHAYVNPVVAVLLGVLLAGEKVSLLQLLGLVTILGSVLLINLAKYRAAHQRMPVSGVPASARVRDAVVIKPKIRKPEAGTVKA